jgi:hypothetical protein
LIFRFSASCNILITNEVEATRKPPNHMFSSEEWKNSNRDLAKTMANLECLRQTVLPTTSLSIEVDTNGIYSSHSLNRPRAHITISEVSFLPVQRSIALELRVCTAGVFDIETVPREFTSLFQLFSWEMFHSSQQKESQPHGSAKQDYSINSLLYKYKT